MCKLLFVHVLSELGLAIRRITSEKTVPQMRDMSSWDSSFLLWS